MQGEKIKVQRRKRGRKIGVFVRLENAALLYIKRRAVELKISQAQFLQNAAGLAGPDMPVKFKFVFDAAYQGKPERPRWKTVQQALKHI